MTKKLTILMFSSLLAVWFLTRQPELCIETGRGTYNLFEINGYMKQGVQDKVYNFVGFGFENLKTESTYQKIKTINTVKQNNMDYLNLI